MSVPFAFFGTPALAVEILDALESAGSVPSLVVTVPDKPFGRGMEMRETPVAAWARARNIPCLKPAKLDEAFLYELRSTNYVLSIVVAYGKILPQAVLDIMPMYNVHYSLLPRWRGATPVESAILAGDTETGVAIQRIVHELDAGPLVAVETTPIGENETGRELRTRLNGTAKELLVRIFPDLAAGTLSLSEQDRAQATFCGKIDKEDGLIDLSDNGEILHRKFRAYYGWPGLYTYFERGGKSANRRMRTIIVSAHREGKKFVVDSVKPEGKGEMPYAEFLRSGAKPVSPPLH